MRKYLMVWLKASTLSAQSNLEQRFGALMFVVGKFIRFGSFLLLLVIVGDRVGSVSGYTLNQMITFFLVFNFFDMVGQILFRGIYWFRDQIISGEFDFRLVKPINPLFMALTRETDILDLPLLITVLVVLIGQFADIGIQNQVLFVVLTGCAFLVIAGVHVFVAALGIITTEVDHTIMIYRDLSSMARVPTDIYALPVRILITFFVPITIAYTVPAKAFLGLLTPAFFGYSLLISIFFFWLSLRFWHYALTKYSSASS